MKMDKISCTSLVLASAFMLTGCDETDQDTANIDTEYSWSLVWSDEFTGSDIDSEKWSHEVNCWGGGNNEKQCYVDSSDNSFIEDGKLVIRLLKGDSTGPANTEDSDDYDPSDTTTLPYSSARLRTINKGDWKYGRVEVNAKLPEGQGTWPAIWMLPTDWVYGGWAASGEIDIMEAVNLGTTYQDNGETKLENRVHGTLHFGRSWPNNKHAGEAYDFGDETLNPADDFHTYAIEWEEGEIRWFIDDVHYATQTMDGWWSHYQDEEGAWVSGSGAAPFNQDFHLILNLAMGGAWPTAVNDTGIDESITQAEMQVDWVRVYQCDSGLETGKGCGVSNNATSTLNEGVEEPDFPSEVDLSSDTLTLFEAGEMLEGFVLEGWDDASNDVRSISDDVINIKIVDGGNAYIANSGDAVDMSGFVGGELAFDLTLIESDASALTIKMDSGWPNLAPIDILASDLPAAGETKRFSFTIQDFVDSATNDFSISSISNPLVFEPVNNGTTHFTVDNVTFTKPFVLFSDGVVSSGFTFDGYAGWEDPADSREIHEDGYASIVFDGIGNSFFTSETDLDMTDYSDWSMMFDIRIIDMGTNSDIYLKMDSGWPSVSDVLLSSIMSLPADDVWTSVAIPVDSFVNGSNSVESGQMDITAVTNPFVIEGYGGSDLALDIRNVRFEAQQLQRRILNHAHVKLTGHGLNLSYYVGQFSNSIRSSAM